MVYSSCAEPDLLDPLMGSCFFPMLYGQPMCVCGELLLDGGLTDNPPVEVLAVRGATEIMTVVTSPLGTARKTPLHRS